MKTVTEAIIGMTVLTFLFALIIMGFCAENIFNHKDLKNKASEVGR